MAQPRVLVAATTWWPSAARLAVAFRAQGARVSAVCPRGHPLRVLRGLRPVSGYSAARPLRALARAIRTEQPDMVLPTDDRVVGHLHALHAQAGSYGPDAVLLRSVIERSLGAPAFYGLSGTRQPFLEMLEAEGVLVPPGRTIRSADEMRAWFAACGGRCVVKAEGSWGGSGVVVARTADEAEAAFLKMSRPLAARRALRVLLVDRDPYPFVPFLRRDAGAVMSQAFIDGQQANLMAACWQGRLLAIVGADVLRAQGQTGAATVIRLVDRPEMVAVAARVARRLELSGFFGLDFMVEAGTGRHVLIEMNPRATQLGHLRRHGRDLASHLVEALGGHPVTAGDAAGGDQPVALFPQALRFEAGWLATHPARLDVPQGEPELVAELLRRPWTRRSLLARLEGAVRRNEAHGNVLGRHEAARLLARLSVAPPPAGQGGA